jgi:hypothetical protein
MHHQLALYVSAVTVGVYRTRTDTTHAIASYFSENKSHASRDD